MVYLDRGDRHAERLRGPDTELSMRYLRLWIDFYLHPVRFAIALDDLHGPRLGFLASLQRALMDGLLLYLPLAMMGRRPPEPSYLRFISDEHYYAALVVLSPLVLLGQWLLVSSAMHVALRLAHRRCDFDRILNVAGFTALGVGTVLLLWDWLWVTAGGIDQYALGMTHLLIDLWGVVVAAICLRVMFDVPLWAGGLANILGILVALPVAIMFMRAPV